MEVQGAGEGVARNSILVHMSRGRRECEWLNSAIGLKILKLLKIVCGYVKRNKNGQNAIL